MRRGKHSVIQIVAILVMLLSLTSIIAAAAVPSNPGGKQFAGLAVNGVSITANDTELAPGESTSVAATVTGSLCGGPDSYRWRGRFRNVR